MKFFQRYPIKEERHSRLKIKEMGYTKMTNSSSSQQGCDRYHDDQVVVMIKDMLRTAPYLPPNRACCIQKVPVKLRHINKAAYTPQIISIGLLHRGDKKLQPMQAYKIDFLDKLLRRRKPDIELGDVVKFLSGLEERVRSSYFNREFACNISSNDFVQMMLLDGCFIVGLFLTENMLWEPYSSIIRSDLTLFENQLPYFLLDELFNFINHKKKICEYSFFDLSARYFSDFLKKEDACRLRNSDHQVQHFLDLILNCQRPSGLVKDDNEDKKLICLPSANELHEFGVEFKKSESLCYLDITFNKNGVLEIPVLDVDREHIFRNMIAMEQCQVSKTDAYITHYIMLLDSLISTPKDVALLRHSMIINNYSGSDEAVAELVNKLGTGVIADVMDSPYYEHIKNTNAFYNKRRNKWKANLKKNYFQNPWTIISLTAAIVLLVCTLVQTVCSVLK